MNTDQNKRNLQRVFDEAFNRGDLRVIDELCAPDYILHDATGDYQGPQGFKNFVKMYRTAFPDTHIQVLDLIAEGDQVAARSMYTGTNTGAFMGIPATGKAVKATGIVVTRMEGDRAAESWTANDSLGLMQQLGLGPRMA